MGRAEAKMTPGTPRATRWITRPTRAWLMRVAVEGNRGVYERLIEEFDGLEFAVMPCLFALLRDKRRMCCVPM
jgi:hypothetical protein